MWSYITFSLMASLFLLYSNAEVDSIDRGAPFCSLASSIECDLQALLFIKSKLEPSAQQFYWSWSGSDPCDGTWLNVYCKDITNKQQFRVTKLLVGIGHYIKQGPYWHFRRPPQSIKFFQRLPVEFTKMQWMEQLQLHGAEYSGSIFPEISTMKKLTIFTSGYSFITGTLPPEISELSRLLVLDLSGNSITGTLPPQLSKLSQIEVLDVDYNQISGTLHPQYSELIRMVTFSPSYNQIQGIVPPEISNLQKLGWLDFSFNLFTGTLPPQVSVLSNLTNLFWQQNQLTGTVPPQYSTLTAAGIFVFPQDGDLCLEREYESIVNDTTIIYC